MSASRDWAADLVSENMRLRDEIADMARQRNAALQQADALTRELARARDTRIATTSERALASLQTLVKQLERIGGYAPQREQDELREARAVLAESEGERAATAKPRACEACSELASRLAVSEAALESLRAAIRALTGEL